ncbi:DUF4157 domain-containing protein [Halobaculum sp. MBLA0147]|uniref:eCIS core domain-containing protein n=1 Tax=Halobaculum sp. MBLA0147 TaxID=3079934 RepID=UPI003524B38F
MSETDGEQSSGAEGDDDKRWVSRSSVGPNTGGKVTKEQAEAYYGRSIADGSEYEDLLGLEKQYGRRLHRWIDEGMPIDAMGTPSKMQRFRDRKDSEIPWNIEEFNEDSLDENTDPVFRKRRRSPAGRTSVPDSVREVISSPGRPLDTSIQRAVEERMGDSLGDVRIHTGPKAAEAADQINARAFTVGNHVAFGAGEYDPESAEGQHVLAHELAHVRQQTGGDLSMLPQEGVQLEIDPDPKLEREAEETARRVMSGGKLGIQKLSDTEVHVQRVVGVASTLGNVAGTAAEMAKTYRDRRRLEGQEQFEEAADRGNADGHIGDSVPADPELLAEEVAKLKRQHAQVLEVITTAAPGAAGGQNPVKTGTKGVLGSLAGMGTGAAVGGIIGSVVPGAGTALGAAAGTAIGGAVSDLTKRGVEYADTYRPSNESLELEQMYHEMRQMYAEMKEGSASVRDSEGFGRKRGS